MSSSLLVFVIAFASDDEPLAIRSSRNAAENWIEFACEMNSLTVSEDYIIKPYFLEIIRIGEKPEYELDEVRDERQIASRIPSLAGLT